MEKNPSQKRIPVMKKMLCVLFSILSILMIVPCQPTLVAEAVEDTTIISNWFGQTVELKPNVVYYSPHRTYTCVFQSDGNLAVYRHRPWLLGDQLKYNNIVWASCTSGNSNSKCYLQKDGNLVIYNASGRAIFSAGYSNKFQVRSELRLSDLGVLTLHSNFSDRWNTRNLRNGRGYPYRFEPDACRLVGRWVAMKNNGQSSNAYIDIDFPDYPPNPDSYNCNFIMKVDFKKVANIIDGRWKSAENVRINTDSFESATLEGKDWKFVIVGDCLGTDGDTIPCVYCNDDGTELDLGVSPLNFNTFKRKVYY